MLVKVMMNYFQKGRTFMRLKIIFVDAMCVSSALSMKRKSHFTPREIESSYICGFQACAASRNCSYLL